MASISPAVRSDLAPTGTMRVGINHGNLVLAQKNATTGEVKGVAVDLAHELGRRLGVPVELVQYGSAGQMTDALATGAWDVAFLAREAGRAGEIGFTAPHLLIEGTYLIPAGAPYTRVPDVDRAGVRIAVSEKSAYDHFLTRNIKHATLVRAPGNSAGVGLVQGGKADVIAGRATAAADGPGQAPGLEGARRPLHGDRAGDGPAQGPRRGPRLREGLHRGDEGLRLRGAGPGEVGRARRAGRAAREALTRTPAQASGTIA